MESAIAHLMKGHSSVDSESTVTRRRRTWLGKLREGHARLSQDIPFLNPSESAISSQQHAILSLGNSLPMPAGNSMIKASLLTCQSCFWGTDINGLGDPVGI